MYNPHTDQWDYFYPGYENWYHVQAPTYHYHHRTRRKYGPYLVPSDPYLLHSAPSEYYYATGFPSVHQPRRYSNHVG